MDEKVISEILTRLRRLEATAVRLRIGTITNRSPISVQLGGAVDEAGDPIVYQNAKTTGNLAENDRVAALLAGNDLVVLGQVGRGINSGSVQVAASGGTTTDVAITHDLGAVPRVVVATIGEGSNAGLNVGVMARTTTTFTLRLRHVDAAPWSGPAYVYWLAIAE
jgi:hypothetical protein